jgi:hypothetical protein
VVCFADGQESLESQKGEQSGMSTYTDKLQQLEQAARTQTPMPRYQSHKKVWALKIANIEILTPTIADLEAILNGPEDAPPVDRVAAIITPADEGYGAFGVPKSSVDKHDPQVGGYFVQYDDGYISFSPAKAFEEGYTRL